jgi:superfamily II DNA or RNA helicase
MPSTTQRGLASALLDEIARRCDAGRLARGRALARSGRLDDLIIGPGFAMACAEGSSAETYEVALRWNEESPSCAGMDLELSCSCPDKSLGRGRFDRDEACKHLVALGILVAERLDGRESVPPLSGPVLVPIAGEKPRLLRILISEGYGGLPDRYTLSVSFFPPPEPGPPRGRPRRRAVPIRRARKHQGGGAAWRAFLDLCRLLPRLRGLLWSPRVEVGKAALARFLEEAEPDLEATGSEVALSRGLRKVLKPRAVFVARLGEVRPPKSLLGLEALLSYDRKIALGGVFLSPEEFEALVRGNRQVVAFREGFARIDPREASRALREAREREPSALALVRAGLEGGSGFSADARELIASLFRERDAPIPASLNALLRPYQERGFRWAFSNLMSGFGCVLADDMGLGKTIQAIALMLALREGGLGSGGFLVVAPASLLSNWERELARFAPTLESSRFHGPGRYLREGDGVVVTTYETAARDAALLSLRGFALLVADEAQLLKNAATKRARALASLGARYKIALSGTPVENRLEDMRAIFALVMPGYLGSPAEFRKRYGAPIERNGDGAAAERLRRVTAPFLMRRLKTDPAIAPELPEKTTVDEYACLAEEQAALYESVVRKGLEEARKAEEPSERLALILRLLTSLKQVCDHPRVYDKESPALPELSGKALLLLELLGRILEGGEKVLVFSQYVECLELLKTIVDRELREDCLLFSGRLGQDERREAVDAFQNDRERRIMLISLRAGGVGLNLTAASRVIHYDLWFNPAVENQATDRAFRIGQARNVFVHRLITEGTFEEKIDAMLKSKRKLAELSLATGESWLSRLDDEEIRDIFER